MTAPLPIRALTRVWTDAEFRHRLRSNAAVAGIVIAVALLPTAFGTIVFALLSAG